MFRDDLGSAVKIFWDHSDGSISVMKEDGCLLTFPWQETTKQTVGKNAMAPTFFAKFLGVVVGFRFAQKPETKTGRIRVWERTSTPIPKSWLEELRKVTSLHYAHKTGMLVLTRGARPVRPPWARGSGMPIGKNPAAADAIVRLMEHIAGFQFQESFDKPNKRSTFSPESGS